MYGHFSIELAHLHQRDLLDYASQNRIAVRTARSRRASLATRFSEWRRARPRSAPVPAAALATVGSCGSR